MMLTTGQDAPGQHLCQDLVQIVDKQQDFGEFIAPLLPRQNKVSLFHVLLPQGKKKHHMGLAKTVRLLFWILLPPML